MSALIEENDDLFRVTVASSQKLVTGCFLSMFLTFGIIFWTILLLVLASQIDIPLFCFTVFIGLGVACLLLSILVATVYGQERVTIRSDGIGYEWIVLRLLRQKFMPIHMVQRFQRYVVETDSDTGWQTFGIEVVGREYNLQLRTFIDEYEREWLIWKLNDVLEIIRPKSVSIE